ncbi:MAG: LysR family transcriptional regulator, partial [Gammaproteobacteria bacterium]|nr:LysR family transcriptional regulator [Gammaproteobacteria bacterium]
YKRQDVGNRLNGSNPDGIVSMVENNTIDLGVVEAPVANKNLVVETCRMDQLVLVVQPEHELATIDEFDLHRLKDYPYICREEGSGTREVLRDCMQQIGLDQAELNLVMELGSPEAIKGAVESGMGISILSRSTVSKELRLGTLVAVNLNPLVERPFSFVHQKQKFRLRAMEELLQFAREYCEAHQNIEL